MSRKELIKLPELVGEEFQQTIVIIGGRRFVAESHLVGLKVESIRKDGALITGAGIPLRLIDEITEGDV